MGKVNFFMVPNDIFDLKLSGSDMLVLMYLLRCADVNTRECFPSYDKIRKSCKMTRATAIKSINNLCSKGIIVKLSIGHYDEYTHKANTYRISNIFKCS